MGKLRTIPGLTLISSNLNSNHSNLLDLRNLLEQVKKAFCSDLSLFENIVLVISKILQTLGLQSRISKVFLDLQNIFFSQQVRTSLVTKYHFYEILVSKKRSTYLGISNSRVAYSYGANHFSWMALFFDPCRLEDGVQRNGVGASCNGVQSTLYENYLEQFSAS